MTNITKEMLIAMCKTLQVDYVDHSIPSDNGRIVYPALTIIGSSYNGRDLDFYFNENGEITDID
jgi:hypothetical protein